MMRYPHLRSLHNDSRFQTILRRSRARFDEMLTVLADARTRGELPNYLERPLGDVLKTLGIRGI